uniref:T cell receptor beta variable 12-5 n=1 Tax=Papio anubis TaxID=9555 RepID=A0A8I5NCE4_PAPAN
MATRLLCCLVLCLLGEELIDAGVTQTPRHKVTEMGQEVTMRCQPILGHNTVFWYRQTVMQGLELLVYLRNKASLDDSGMPKDRFSAEMPDASLATLKIQPSEPRDSAVYLCASGLVTVLQNRLLPVQKPWCFLFSSSTQQLSAAFLAPPPAQEVRRFGVPHVPRQGKNRS